MDRPEHDATEPDTILVVDDAEATVEVICRNLDAAGYRTLSADSVERAVGLLEQTPVDLVITDYKMPKTTGLDLVHHVRANLPDTEIMMITGYASVTSAVEAVKAGAEDYLEKPFTDEELLGAVGRVLDKLHLRRRAAREPGPEDPASYGLIGSSAPMLELFATIHKAAQTRATVLITGETGTGKELVARAVHYASERAASPFVPVNCGGIPEGLLERELFGHRKGAFTGANETRAGFFQTANGGTLFLDEIGETSGPMQVKLLRVLQEHVVCLIGDTKPVQLDLRVIAASNKDLATLVERDRFREDLFYRLAVITIEVPPLRAREDDVAVLAHHFAAKFAAELDRPPPRFSDAALAALSTYDWPGNVRELENLVQRVCVMSDREVVDVADLPSPMRFSLQASRGLDRSLAQVERDHVQAVLEHVGGNKSEAARILQISRKTLREKLKDEVQG